MALGSMCAVHPNAPSVITCRRCGRFCCTNCLPQFETCPECVQRATLALPPLEGRAMMASLGLWACAGVHGVMAAISIGQLATGQTDGEGALVLISGLAAVLYAFVFLPTVVLFCMWFHRATQHALARGAVLDAASPGSAVVSWFIPVLNLVRPFNVARGLLASAGLETGSVNAWQGMWIVGKLASNTWQIAGAGARGVEVLSDLLLLGAAITAAQIVNRLKWPSGAQGSGGREG